MTSLTFVPCSSVRQLTRPERAGFTVVELLVTVFVVLALAALLGPSLASAKGSAGRAFCLSSQHQLHIAWRLYSDDNNERLVANDANAVGQTSRPSWVAGVLNYNPANRSNTNAHETVAEGSSLFAPYQKNPALYRCSNDRSTITTSAGLKWPRVRSVGMNAFLGDNAVGLADVPFREFHRTSDLAIATGQIFLFIEQLEDSIDDAHFWMHMTKIERFEEFPGSAHNRGGILSFVDGAAEYRRWLGPGTVYRHQNTYRSAANVPNNKDLQWLQSRTSNALPGFE